MRPYLDNKFHFLLKPNNPVTQELLGPDLEQKISDGTRVVDAGRWLFPNHRLKQFNPRHRQGSVPHTSHGHTPCGRGVDIIQVLTDTSIEAGTDINHTTEPVAIRNPALKIPTLILLPMGDGDHEDKETDFKWILTECYMGVE